MRHFLIDTDDAVALVTVLNYPDVQAEAEAIAVVNANVYVDQGVQNAVSNAKPCGMQVLVHRGMEKPLPRPQLTLVT